MCDKKEQEPCNYRFFQHRSCEYFPCHSVSDPDSFSCLFCYCPLYALGDKCGGSFRYTDSGVKDCSGCTVPHRRENFDYIMDKLGRVVQLVRK